MRGRHARYRPGGHLRVGEVVLVVGLAVMVAGALDGWTVPHPIGLVLALTALTVMAVGDIRR